MSQNTVTVSDPTATRTVKQALARTYDHPTDDDPWTIVEEYEQVQRVAAKHPELGSSALSNRVDLPRSRIRHWVDADSRPDPVRGIHTCESHGWFVDALDSPTLHNLAILLAWIYSGGSITEQWVPLLAVTEASKPVAISVLEALDTRPTTVREGSTSRGTEVRPTRSATALGRLAVALGAPRGSKHEGRVFSLPPWLSETPESVRLAFARTYVQNRGTDRPDLPTTPVQIHEERPVTFRNELFAFFEELLDEQAIRGEGVTFRLTHHAVQRLDRTPTVR